MVNTTNGLPTQSCILNDCAESLQRAFETFPDSNMHPRKVYFQLLLRFQAGISQCLPAPRDTAMLLRSCALTCLATESTVTQPPEHERATGCSDLWAFEEIQDSTFYINEHAHGPVLQDIRCYLNFGGQITG